MQFEVLTAHVPLSLTGREVWADLLDLEPVSRAICGSGARDLAHVEGNGSLMVDSLVSCEGHG